MKLTPRLQTIADKVIEKNIVADIGTDHGYIPIYLVSRGISPKVIAADINEGPLENAKNQIKQYKLEDKIEARLGSGLDVLKPNEVDTVIIAGMGGLLIRDILQDRPDITKSIKQFILQPMVAQGELRNWLSKNGFRIVDEQLAKEGHKFYEIIVATIGAEKNIEHRFYDIGHKLIDNKDPLMREYIIKQINIQQTIINELTGECSIQAKDKYSQCKERIKILEEVLRCL